MPVRGTSLHDLLRPYLDHERARFGDLEFFDAHTHMGRNDPDGHEAEPAEILAAMDAARQRRALLFAMQEPGGEYRAANDAVLAACAASDGRLLALARVGADGPGRRRRGAARSGRGRGRREAAPAQRRLHAA